VQASYTCAITRSIR
jgi:hypothetical protein